LSSGDNLPSFAFSKAFNVAIVTRSLR
jgi:hypothetical protein